MEEAQTGFWGRLIGRKAEPIKEPKTQASKQTSNLPVSPIKKKKPPPKGFGRAGSSTGPRPRSFHEERGELDEESMSIEEVLHKAQMTTKFAKRVAKSTMVVAQAVKESEYGKSSKVMAAALVTSQASCETAKTALSGTQTAATNTRRAHVALKRLRSGEGGYDMFDQEVDDTLTGNWKAIGKIKTSSKVKSR